MKVLSPRWADLSEESGFFLELLDDPTAWRQRLVSELNFHDSSHVQVLTSYQVDFPPDLLRDYINPRRTRTVNVLVPLTSRPKEALLNFSISGPNGSQATLTSRASTAALQAQYLQVLAELSNTSGQLLQDIDEPLCEAISVFSPDRFRDLFLQAERRLRGADFEAALQAYLESGLGIQISLAQVRAWRQQTVPTGAILAARLGEEPDPLSSSEEVLLVVPLLPGPPATAGQVGSLVARYCSAVAAANAADDDDFLVALARYGRRYELIVELELPVLRPSRIKIEEDRPLELSLINLQSRPWLQSTVQPVAFGDSRSTHIEARSSDPNVELAAKFNLYGSDGRDISGWSEATRSTHEAVTIYSSDDQRPSRAELRLGLRVSRHLVLTAILVAAANFAALVAVLSLPQDRFYIARLGILAVPTTVAATFVLARQQTALASRLLRYPRIFLGITTMALWIVVVVGLTDYKAPEAKRAEAKSPSPTKRTGTLTSQRKVTNGQEPKKPTSSNPRP
jgi:hypothetical protein